MNKVNLIGRLTKDAELKTSESGKKYCTFNIAVSRGKDNEGNDLGADFPLISAFGKTAENLCKYTNKGVLILVEGKIKTGSYVNTDGTNIYQMQIIASKIEYLSYPKPKEGVILPPDMEEITDEDIPF